MISKSFNFLHQFIFNIYFFQYIYYTILFFILPSIINFILFLLQLIFFFLFLFYIIFSVVWSFLFFCICYFQKHSFLSHALAILLFFTVAVSVVVYIHFLFSNTIPIGGCYYFLFCFFSFYFNFFYLYYNTFFFNIFSHHNSNNF